MSFVCYATDTVNNYTFEYRRDSGDNYQVLASSNSSVSPEIEVGQYLDIRCIPCEDGRCSTTDNVADECTNRYRFEEEDKGGFVIQKFDDQDGDGVNDDTEPGLDWNFEWGIVDNDDVDNWHDYVTYADKDGRGGEIGSLKDGQVVRIREKSKDGWEATTATSKEITIEKNEIKLVVFGNRREKPTAQEGEIPTQLPKTGAPLQMGLSLASILGGLSLGLKVLGRRWR